MLCPTLGLPSIPILSKSFLIWLWSSPKSRARLVQEVLEKYDFKVDIKEDSVFARLDIGPKQYMLTRLRILGYISVHTRQLDMVMANEDQAGYYHYKILEDIEKSILPLGKEDD